MGKMKSFKEFSQDEKLVEQYTTEALNFLQRIQKSQNNAKRSKSKRLIGMRRALKRIVSDPEKLFKRAIRQQRKTAKKLLKGVSLATVGIARKIEIEKKT